MTIAEPHDFRDGPAAIRKAFDDEWSGNEQGVRYQPGTCVGGSSLTENQGRRDGRPIKISHIKLLGTIGQTWNPAYLAEGIRTIWITPEGRPPFEQEISCTWLVVFRGNAVETVREASELGYLITLGR